VCVRVRMARSLAAFAVVSLLALSSAVACSAPEEEEVSEAGDDALSRAAEELDEQVRLLGGGRADLEKLAGMVKARVADLKEKQEGAEKTAAADVDSYSAHQWERSFFRANEKELAVEARTDDIFDRPERRALDGAKAQLKLVEQLIALVDQNGMGTLDDPSPAAAYAREGYVEIAISIRMNDELGIMKQVGARLRTMLRKKAPWLKVVFRGLRRDRPSAGKGEAANIDASAAGELWRKDPINSTVWHPRKPEEITPAKLYAGPWFKGALPRLPKASETWKLTGLRSQMADGSHAAADIAFEGAKVKLKFREATRDFWEDAPHARLLWAMGYETDPQYNFADVRVEPRVFIAAHASIERIGIKFGNRADEIIPGRPPKGLSVALHGIRKAPGVGWVDVHFKDGHVETGEKAIKSLEKATDDRALMDTMESVLVKRAYGEVANPLKRDGIGPWDYDADNHVDDREVRAVAIVMNAWLGSNDLKFNNVRLDVERPKDGPTAFVHVLSDVGGIPANVPWDVGINPKGPYFHPDTNNYTVRAFDRLTENDAKWGVARIAALSEEQIVACLATGAHTDAVLAVHTEKLISRRDELVRVFHLEKDFGQLRSCPAATPTCANHGVNRNPAPRHYKP
jgi:hypothetical protein